MATRSWSLRVTSGPVGPAAVPAGAYSLTVSLDGFATGQRAGLSLEVGQVSTLDLVLPPGSGKVPITAFCVEQGRWSARGEESAQLFGSADKSLAGKELKRKDTGENYGSITVSMGVARMRQQNDTLPTLVKRADDALYQSKNLGRNRVTRAGD